MIRHLALLTFAEATTDEQVRAIESALAGLPGRIPELVAYTFGRDLAIDAGNASFAVVAEVADEEGYAAYRDHPEHQRIIAELIRPVLAARSAIQVRI
ncbi:MAG: Dabb family protein [Actinomycetota bacterium]